MTCMAGMVTMTTLNNHPRVVKIPTTTASTTTPINSTAMMSTSTTTTTKTMISTTKTPTSAMLFLQKKYYNLIDTEGELETTFGMNGQEVYCSCGVTFRNKQYIFGGQYTNNKQILQVKNCGLYNIGSLDFVHYHAACGSTDEVMVLCFGTGDTEIERKRCRQAALPNGPWTEMELPSYAHKITPIAASQGTK